MENVFKKKISEGSLGIVWIGQGGFIFETSENEIVIIDPYLSNSVEKKDGQKRMVDIPIKPEDIVADFLLCTHNHLDHTDPDTIGKIKKVNFFLGPSSVCSTYRKLKIPEEKIIKMSRGTEKEFKNMKIIATFAKHTEDSVGYVLDFNGIIVYITGDTEYDTELEKVSKLKPDIMLTCINGKYGNMNYKEAVKLVKKINPTIVIPMHYGMFKENTVDPNLFINELEKEKINCKKAILNLNEYFVYKKEG